MEIKWVLPRTGTKIAIQTHTALPSQGADISNGRILSLKNGQAKSRVKMSKSNNDDKVLSYTRKKEDTVKIFFFRRTVSSTSHPNVPLLCTVPKTYWFPYFFFRTIYFRLKSRCLLDSTPFLSFNSLLLERYIKPQDFQKSSSESWATMPRYNSLILYYI